MASSLPRLVLLTLVTGSVAAWAADEASLTPKEISNLLDATTKNLNTAKDEAALVERQYSQREEATPQAAREQRFAEGEIQYLLGEYNNASNIFYDLISNSDFQSNPRYVQALYYLADSLFQQKNYLGSRFYLKKVLAARGERYRESLERYLEIAGRTNEFAGVEELVNQARGMTGGELSPDLTYAYAKWMFRRKDLAVEQRVARAQNLFAALVASQGSYAAQASYYIGVGYVKLKNLESAAQQFRNLTQTPAGAPTRKDIRELAILALARVYFEQGKFAESLAAYRSIPFESPSYADALYEAAWCYVRLGQLDRAMNSTEVLDMVVADTTVEPDAKILMGTLQMKNQRYEQAMETYDGVISKYGAVRDDIDGLLHSQADPVKYFEGLLAQSDKSVDVSSLLPPLAVKWAGTQQEVANALELVGGIKEGRGGVSESRAIAERILKALDERGTEVFPELQEGLTKINGVENAVVGIEATLTRIEVATLDRFLTPEQRKAVADARANVERLSKRLQDLPSTPQEVEARRAKLQKLVDDLEKSAFDQSAELQSAFAQLVAIQKYYNDTKNQITKTPEEERTFLEKMSDERKNLSSLEEQLKATRARIVEERATADTSTGGEGGIRAEYETAQATLRDAYAAVRGQAGGDAGGLLQRCDGIRAEAGVLKNRVEAARKIIKERVARRAGRLRETVVAEQSLLEGYGADVSTVASNASDLVGKIAFDSFKRVRQSFYELVLKADVGRVDVAFTKKQDMTTSIQKLSAQKEQELKQLDEEFKEVLKDVD